MLDGGNFRGQPDTRLLDPACGSGTFLVMAINAIRRNSIAQTLPPAQLLRKICHNIVGIDLNPLAVIAARTNYLLALGPLLKRRGTEPLDIPVYLADSVLTPSQTGDTLFEENKVTVTLAIGDMELPRSLATQEGVSTLTELLDRALDKSPPPTPEEFTRGSKKALTAAGANWDRDHCLICTLYKRIAELHAAGRNGLWARVIKNAFAPVFLAPFDYVAGNPPWINWQNLPEGYRERTKKLWFHHGLFVHSGMDTILGKGKKDISMLMTYVAADSYLKDGGKLGFVITQSVFKTTGAGQGFRRFRIGKGAVGGTPLACLFVDDFSEIQLFEGATNRTAVFIIQKGEKTRYPINCVYWRKKKSGRRGGFDYDSTLDEVLEKTQRLNLVAEPINPKDATSAWLTGRKAAVQAARKLFGKADYEAHEGVNTGGANAVYWFEILKDHGDGTVTARNIAEGAKRKIDSVQVRLEKDLLYPLLRGRDVSRWRAEASAHILFVQDVIKRRGIAENVMRRDFPLALDWLDRNKKSLLQRAAFKRYFRPDRDPYYSMFNSGEYTIAPWKVGWKYIASELTSTVIPPTKKLTIADHRVIIVTVDGEEEAHFVCGLLNSTPARMLASLYIVETQIAPHILDNLRIVRFDPGSSLHRRIGTEARRIAEHHDDSQLSIHTQLDELCGQLWSIDQRELKSVQDAYIELHLTTPDTTESIADQEADA